jgi:hypothetical protein
VRDLTIRVGDTEAETLFDSELDEPTLRSQVDDPLDIGGDTSTEVETTDTDDAFRRAEEETEARAGEGEATDQQLLLEPESEPRAFEPEYTGETSGYRAIEADAPDSGGSTIEQFTTTAVADDTDVGMDGSDLFENTFEPEVDGLQGSSLTSEPGVDDGVDTDVFEAPGTDVGVDARTAFDMDIRLDSRNRFDARTDVGVDTGIDLETDFDTRTRIETEPNARKIPSDEDPDLRSTRFVSQQFDSASEQWETGFEESEDAYSDLFGGGR